MRRGSLRAAEEITGHKYETISGWLKRAAAHAEALTQVLASDVHLSQVEIDEFWSFVQKKRGQLASRTLTLTQTIKHRDEHGRLLSVEICAMLGTTMEPTGTVHVERLNGALRDRLNALTRKTHAFAKRDVTWDALLGLQLFDHNFHRAHQALRLPSEDGVHRYDRRSPAMALGLTDHLWSFQELLTTRIPITP